MKKVVTILVFVFLAIPCLLSAQATSTWVFVGSDGHLQYKTDANGNHIMDYSYAGYEGGGVKLPVVSVAQTISPVSGDNTSHIQAAIDAVSALTPDANGFRGAVLLQPGTYNVSGTISITAGGVVLRGSGSGSGGSNLNMTGSPHLLLSISGSGSASTVGSSTSITDSFVPSGTLSFHVSSTSGFSVGDTIFVQRPVTQPWVHFMGMDTLTRNGSPQTWISVGTLIKTDRTIAAINGNQITVDAPITDSFDASLLNPPGGSIIKYTFSGRIAQVGVEHLAITAPAADVDISMPQFQALSMNSVINGWLQDLAVHDTDNSISIGGGTKQITLDNVTITHSLAFSHSAGPADFGLSGTRILLNKCSSKGNSGVWPYVVQAEVTGPVVLLNTNADSRGFAPHQRWATGILADSSQFPGGTSGKEGISYSDRGNFGSGQGWDAGWAVAWNVDAANLLVQEPPGVNNWCIGCIGTEDTAGAPGGPSTLPNGIYESLGTHVTPSSLYLAQLCDRLGATAAANIGYSGVCGTADFSLSVTPSSRTVTAGQSTSYTVTVTPGNGFNGTVSLAVSGVPNGANCSGASISGGSGSSAVNCSTSSTTAAGNYTVTIAGTSGSLSHTANVGLTVNQPPPPDFTLTATPSSQAVIAGSGTTYAAAVAPSNGFTGTVALTVGGLPTGASCTGPSITGGSGSSTVSCSTASSVAPATYTLTITGTSGSLSHSVTVSLTVNQAAACTTATANGTWNNSAFASHNGSFTATFDATPSISGQSAAVGISKGTQTANTGFANIVAFSTTGIIQARNGGSYFNSTIPYSGGNSYHFRLAINVTNHTYSVFVTPPGGSEQTVGTNFAFRTEQNTVTSLDHWGAWVSTTSSGTLKVCNFTAQ